MHELPKAKRFDDLYEIAPDIGGRREEAGPVGVEGEGVLVGVGGNVTCAAEERQSLSRYEKGLAKAYPG